MYSQYDEENFLKQYFNDKKGFVVEIGAADGISNSNSRMLIESGWSALLVEPNPNNYQKLVNLYKHNNLVILSNTGCASISQNRDFFVDNNDECQQLSTFSIQQVNKCKKIYNCKFDQIQIYTHKTSDLLDKYNISQIDFLSIDTESYDLEVVKGIDFNKVKIDLICIEDIEASDLLKQQNYIECHSTTGNTFFKKR
jgi:FkbM family methyltransferase